MDDEPPRKPRFWPVVFVAAFLLGAILWGFWMIKIIQQTRAMRNYRMGLTNAPVLVPGKSSDGAKTNAPVVPTNGAPTNTVPK